MIVFSRLTRNRNTFINSQANYQRFPSLRSYHCYSDSKSQIPIVSIPINKKVEWNFKSIDSQQCKVDCLLVLNNENFNKKWIKKVFSQTENILLADGGANILYALISQNSQKYLKLIDKIKAIIGDLDSVTDEARSFYKSHGVKLIKQFDQQKNDFEKTLIYGLQLGCKNFIVSGAFGSRLDHTLSAMSITQKYTKSQKDINIILSNAYYIYCPLRSGYQHKIYASQDIDKTGCGIVTFSKINHIETKGFKWNLGQKEKCHSIQWGQFLSTSNQIVDHEVQIFIKNNDNGVSYFIGKLIDESK